MAPVIIALPGALGGPLPWRALQPGILAVAPEAEFLAWDVLADVESGVAGFDGWAGHFTGRVGELAAGRPVVLLGYSMGARLAMAALAAAPSLVSAAFLVSGHPGLASEEERAARLAEDLVWADRVRSEPWPDLLAAWECRPVFACGKAPAAWRSDLAAAWRADRAAMQDRRAAAARSLDIFSLARQPDFLPALQAFTRPVFWITGALDTKFTAIAQAVAARCPSVFHVTSPEAGHRVPWETNGQLA